MMESDTEEKSFEELERQARHRPPLTWCKFIADKPKWAFGVTLGGHIFLSSLNVILYLAGYNILPVEIHWFPIDLKGSVEKQREDAWTMRNTDDPDKVYRFVLDDLGTPPYRGYSTDDVKLYYTRNSQNVFTKDIFLTMRDIEDQIFNNEVYQSDHCQLNERRQCMKPNSILRYFDGSLSHVDPVFSDPEFDNINLVLYTAYTDPRTTEDFKYFLGKGHKITETDAFSEVTRTAFPLGWPIENNSTMRDYDVVGEFCADHFVPEIEDAIKKAEGQFDVVYNSFIIFDINIIGDVFGDLALAVGSITFIFCFLRFVTKSFWITSWAVSSIISSFLITNLIYRIVLDYIYFGYFHLIAIFIILGIGADDFFVYFNAWEANGLKDYPSIAHRLSHTFRVASGTMFFTSFTTMMAFFAGGISPILALGSFGIFTGVLIAVNYLSVIIFFPTVVYTHHVYYKGTRCCGCKQSNNNAAEKFGTVMVTMKSDTAFVENVHGTFTNTEIREVTGTEIGNGQNQKDISTGGYLHMNGTGSKPPKESEEQENTQHKKENRITEFFRGPYFRFVTHKYIRWVLIGLLLCFVGFCAYSMTNLEVDSEEIKIFTEKTAAGRAMRLEGTGFVPGSAGEYVRVYLVWGLKPRDFSTCHKTDYHCPGVQQWDDVFDMNTPPVQLALRDFCHKLKYNLSSEEKAALMIRNNSLTQQLEVDCFMEELHFYMQGEEERLNRTVSLDYPLTQTNMEEYMRLNEDIYELDKLTPAFYRYFEIGVSNWLSSNYSHSATPDFFKFNPLVGESKDGENTRHPKFHIEQVNSSMSYYGTRLRYAGIQVNLSLSTQELSYMVGLPVRDTWEKFLNDQKLQMPIQLHGGFQLTEVTWHWLTIQKTLVQNAILGIALGLGIAVPMLILATQNVIVGLLAAGTLLAVTICVLGVIPLAGWKVDVMVSLNLCLVVGLSVDYVVHLAEGYHLSVRKDRHGRTQDMLGRLGISVLSGAATTLGAAFFMMFAKIQFFLQFGTFLLCTIGFSLVFSLVLFTAVLGACGPQGETGSLWPPLRAVWYKLTGRGKALDCNACEGRGYVRHNSGVEESGDSGRLVEETEESVDEDVSGVDKVARLEVESIDL